MMMDWGQKLRELTAKRPAAVKEKKRCGYSILLKEGGNRIARFAQEDGKVTLEGDRSVSDEDLKAIAPEAKSIVACFTPRVIYADLGDFSNVTAEATLAHIRSTIDKTGLFNEPYAVAYRKVYDLDKVRARYSYLAVPEKEIEKISVLDHNEVFLDAFCPVEASIAALTAEKSRDMTMAVFEDEAWVRIVGSKSGIVYHLMAISKSAAFDLSAEVLAGVSEMTSMLRNTYGEPPAACYKIGEGEISVSDLREGGFDAAAFACEDDPAGISPCPMLMGTVCSPGYDFTPPAFRETQTFARLSQYSLGVSLAMVLVSVVLILLGIRSASTAQDYEKKFLGVQQGYAREMSVLEQEYSVLLKELDLTRINELVSLFQDFESEPKLYTILGNVTNAVPADMELTRVEMLRSGVKLDSSEGAPPEDPQAIEMPQTGNPTFILKINGLITAQYPQSKILFSTFLSGIQSHYPILGATFKHTEDKATCEVLCEAKK